MIEHVTARHRAWNTTYLGPSLKTIADSIGVEESELEVTGTMSQTEHILRDVPEEFAGVLSYMAYERGHSGGEEEVNILLTSLVHDLAPCIQKFEARIRAEKV